MSKISLSTVASLTAEQSALNTLNSNSSTIQTAFDNTLSRDGTSPNTMQSQFDMNSFQILNLPAASTSTEPVRKAEFDSALTDIQNVSASVAAAAASASSASTSASNASTSATNAALYAGTRWNFESSTAMAAPAAGGLRFNNAAVASVTAIAINAQDAETGNPDASDYIVTWDDSTNTVKGYLIFKKVGTPATFAIFSISAVVDNGTWLQLTVAYVTSNGSWSASDGMLLSFTRTGDAGINGSVAISGVPTNGQVASWTNATTVKGIGPGTTTTLLHGNAAGDPSYSAASLTADVSGVLPLANGGTNANSAANARTSLGLVIGTDVQAQDTELAAIAGLVSAADRLPYFTGSGTASLATFTATGRNLVDDADTTAQRATMGVSYGKQSIWIPAVAMVSRTTNGPPTGTVEMATNKNMFKTLDFDTTTQEFVQFDVRMPKSWDLGTVTFIPVWSHAATATNFGVVWGLDAVAISDQDAGDVAFGTAQTSTDTGGTTNTLYQAPESAAITIAGSPAAGDLVQYRVHRDPANGSDTMAIDARLHGVLLLYTNNTTNDT